MPRTQRIFGLSCAVLMGTWGCATTDDVGEAIETGAEVAEVVANAAADEVVLEKRVMFSDVDGNLVVVEAGNYWVERADEHVLRLTPPSGNAVLIQALAGTHEEEDATKIALAEPWADDEYHIVLFLPDGVRLDARGSYSGVQERRGSMISPGYRTKLQARYSTKRQLIRNVYKRRIYTQVPVAFTAPVDQSAANLVFPQVTSVSPSPRGTQGSEIRFIGRDFDTQHFQAKLGSTNLVITSRTTTEVKAQLPNQKIVADLRVSHGAPNNEYVLRTGYEVIAPPVISSVSPQNFVRGERVTIHGTDLDQIYPFSSIGMTINLPPLNAEPEFVHLENPSAPYGYHRLRIVNWQVSADRTQASFNAMEEWAFNTSQIWKKSSQPASLSGTIRVRKAGSSSATMTVPSSVTWQYDPGLQVTSMKSTRWGTNFIIVTTNILENQVDFVGRGMYTGTKAYMGETLIGPAGDSYGTNTWVRIPYQAESGPITLNRAPYTTNTATLKVFSGPQFLPGTFDQFGTGSRLQINVNQTYTIQGWELSPSGFSGLTYQLYLSGLAGNGCNVNLRVLEHTTSALSFKVESTGEIPASCDNYTLFGGTNTSNMLFINAWYGDQSMELLRKSYFLQR